MMYLLDTNACIEFVVITSQPNFPASNPTLARTHARYLSPALNLGFWPVLR